MSSFYHILSGLVRRPGFVALVVLTLALGIGVNTAIFSVVNAFLFRPIAVDRPQELVSLYATGKIDFLNHLPFSYADYVEYRDQNAVFSGVLMYNATLAAVGRGDQAQLMNGEVTSGNYFEVLGVKPAIGRLFTSEDDRPGADRVTVLSYLTWKRRFNSDPLLIGQTVVVAGTPHTVIGVAAEDFRGLFKGLESTFWQPIQAHVSTPGSIFADSINEKHGSGNFSVIARLKPGTSFDQANANVQTIARRLTDAFPDTNKDVGVVQIPLNRIVIHPDADGPIYGAAAVVMVLSGLVLLIACANLANLLLVRAISRRKEIAIRLALGESRSRLVRELMIESALLSVMGGIAGLPIAGWCNQLLNTVELPIPVEIALGLALDGRVLAFTFAISLITGAAFGLMPAWQAFRTEVFPALKDEGTSQSGGGRSRARVRTTLVVAQVTLSLVLLIFGGLAFRSLQNASAVNPGFNLDQMVTGSIAIALNGYTNDRGKIFYQDLLDRVRSSPGVRSATLTTGLPLTLSVRLTRVGREGQEKVPEEDIPFIDTTNVWPGYFATMEMPIIEGREFAESDTESGPAVAVINEAFSRTYWPNESALGKRLLLGYPNRKPVEIVGVVRNGKYRTLGEDPRPFIYSSLKQDHEGIATIVVRVSTDTSAGLSAIRDSVRSIDANLPVFGLQTLNEHIGPALLLPRYAAGIFGAFGIVGALLAVVGLYGVIAYSVSQRTQEMGIRIALGGARSDVMRLVVGEGMRLTAIGLCLGLAISLLSSRLLSSILYGIGANDPMTFATISLAMIMVTLLACYIPARRATRVDPMVALRHE